MKANQNQIDHLADQFNDMIESLSPMEFFKFELNYNNHPVRTAWNMYWSAYDQEPELWRQETKDWKDSHIQTLIKNAMKQTILPANKIK